MAKSVFNKLKKILIGGLKLELKKRLVKTWFGVWPCVEQKLGP